MASESELETPAAIIESVNCDSCGFSEDCTQEYIALVRNRFDGKWICGLCAEAVKDEVVRSGEQISTEEALKRHTGVCKEFRDSSRFEEEKNYPIEEIGRILRKSLDQTTSSCSKSGNVGK